MARDSQATLWESRLCRRCLRVVRLYLVPQGAENCPLNFHLKGKKNPWVNDFINLKHSLSHQTQGTCLFLTRLTKELLPPKRSNENIIIATTSSRQLLQKKKRAIGTNFTSVEDRYPVST